MPNSTIHLAGGRSLGSDRAFAGLLLLTALAIALYWADYFGNGTVVVIEEEWYQRFERAFVIADIYLAACCIAAAVALLRRRRAGAVFFSLLAGSALIYLALMDITFNMQNELYPLAARTAAMWFEILINAWTLTLGVALVAAKGRPPGGPNPD